MFGWRLSRQCRNAERVSCNDALRLSSGEVLPAMPPKFMKLFGDHSHRGIHLTSGTKNFSSAERSLKTETVVASLRPSLTYRTKRGRDEASDQRKPINYRQWHKRQFESFIGKFASYPSLSRGCMEALRPLGAPPADQGTEENSDGVVPSHASKIWRRQIRACLEHRHG